MGGIGFLASLMHSLVGFGGALFMAAMLAPVIGLKDAVPVTAAAMIIANISRSYVFWPNIPWRVIALVVPASIPGIILGAYIFTGLSDILVSILIGGYLVLIVTGRRLVRGSYSVDNTTLGCVSLIYGVIAGMTFGAGLILAPFLMGAGLVGSSLIATMAVCGLVLNTLKSIVFGWSEVFGPSIPALGLIVGGFTIPGTFVGKRLLYYFSAKGHAYLLEISLFLVGLYLLYEGVHQYQINGGL